MVALRESNRIWLHIKIRRYFIMTIINTNNVRRLDDLGRVVIPKEIRRQLRWGEGDPLEIYINEERQLILKKYSPIGELGDFAKEYADSLYESTGHIALIGDRDEWVAEKGSREDSYLNKKLPEDIQYLMEQRKVELSSYRVVVPIIVEGDVVGVVMLLSRFKETVMSDMEVKIAEVAAGFLAKQLEM
jgi:AbrB family transcriptional regulator (stage V sporulation protein T)